MDIDTATKSPAPARPTRRRPRGKGIRVRTGCLACRHRHLKCDETQPICRGCQKASRECVYPHRQEEAASQRREASKKAADETTVTSTSQQLDGVVASTVVDDHARRTSATASSARDEHVPAHQSPAAVETTAERQGAQSATQDLLTQNDGQPTDHLSAVYPDENATFLRALTSRTFTMLSYLASHRKRLSAAGPQSQPKLLRGGGSIFWQQIRATAISLDSTTPASM
jgi:hypothetical protein